MTNAQKWIAAFLGLFLVLFILGKITEKDDVPYHHDNYPEQTQTTVTEVDGFTLIKQTGCTACHGSNLEGTNMAPALLGLEKYWTRDGLINYLRNPSSYSGDARFKDYKLKYKNIIMPAYNNIDVKDLGKMADYLLTK